MQNAIITSLLDTDLYKFTMMQCVWHQFPDAQVVYRFKSRKPLDLKPYIGAIKEQINQLCSLRLTAAELQYLASLPFFKVDFLRFLQDFQLNPEHVQIQIQDKVDITIQGPWLQTILFEIPLLAIVSECFYQQAFANHTLTLARANLQNKIALIKQQAPQGFNFSEFGTRRRYSKSWQEELLYLLKAALPEQLVGTSNVLFAKNLALRPIGTMAHEFLQACQVLSGDIKGSQAFALETWLKEYQGALSIALTDVLTFDIFLSEFNQTLAEQYAGLRQDSGDPLLWGDKAIKHYESLGINPRTKTFIFSDALTFPKAFEIFSYFKGRVQTSFGIGTHLTNDVGLAPLDIVIKMIYTNHQPVIKISDSPGKIICEDENHLQRVKQLFSLEA